MGIAQGFSAAARTSAPVQMAPQAAREGWELCLSALNIVRCPAIAIDQLGFVVSANMAMDPLFDKDIRIKNKRLLIANAQARSQLEALIQHLVMGSEAPALHYAEPIVIIRSNGRQPVIINSVVLSTEGRKSASQRGRNPHFRLFRAKAVSSYVSTYEGLQLHTCGSASRSSARERHDHRRRSRPIEHL